MVRSLQAKPAVRAAIAPPPTPAEPIEAAHRPTEAAAQPKPDGKLREHMISEAAYYRALTRGCDGADPVEDWLAAEREIDERFGFTG